MAIYGGFAGHETNRAQRDWVNNVTILSGDFLGDDEPGFVNYDENAWHVVTGSQADVTAVLDGFTVRGGNADGPYDSSYYYGYNVGGGMFISRGGSPTLVNLTFVENTSTEWGAGALHISRGGVTWLSDPTLINCSFVRNEANYAGAVSLGTFCRATLINCTFFENTGYHENP